MFERQRNRERTEKKTGNAERRKASSDSQLQRVNDFEGKEHSK